MVKDRLIDNSVDGEKLLAEELSATGAEPGGSRVISRILPPAIRLWLQTQVDHIENLVFRIEGRDRQILSGYVPRVVLAADRAVYQGLHLSHAQVQALEIRINLGQVLRGKPLRLLQKFPVAGNVVIQEADLNASLQAPLLRDGLRDFLKQLMAVQGPEHDLRPYLASFMAGDTARFQTAGVAIAANLLTLTLLPGGESDPAHAVTLRTGLAVRDGHILVLHQPTVIGGSGLEQRDLDDFELDLGPEVQIESLQVEVGRLEISGTVQVVPAD
ncbi:MAG TPA: DUF2993 domain-containing protein [Leptolyngbyaceae cyanobacterium]